MKKSERKERVSPILDNSFRNLLICLFVYLVISPFLTELPYAGLLVDTILSLTLFSAIYTINRESNKRNLAILLLLPTLVLIWLAQLSVVTFSREFSLIILICYLGLLTYLFLDKILHARKVTLTLLYTALSLYLIIGMFWGSLYACLFSLSPGSYSGTLLQAGSDITLHTFNYFSFATLTTLGYGDITPQTQGAAALCQAEAIIGQFFTAVLIARLVGLYTVEEGK